MFGRKKKEQEKLQEREKTTIRINESQLKTKDGEIIRCENIAAHFNNKEETKEYSHDMVRQCFITTTYTMTLDEIQNAKEKYEEAVLIEINSVIAKAPFICDTLTIEKISKVEVR